MKAKAIVLVMAMAIFSACSSSQTEQTTTDTTVTDVTEVTDTAVVTLDSVAVEK